MGKNKKNNGIQQGALDHAPSQHGPKTRARIAQIDHTPNPDRDKGPRHDPEEIRNHAHDAGKDRLFAGRQQHDEAESNSEKTRVARDIDRHNHWPEDDLHHKSREAMAKRKS
jgi:hypothetical protein